MKLLSPLVLVSLVTFLTSEAVAQKRAVNRPPATAGHARPVCQGEAIPKGQVVVGVKSSNQCSSSLELVTKKPSDSEIVCDASPVPPSYSVSEMTSSQACNSPGSNPLTNAMLIVRDGTVAVRPPVRQTPPRQDSDEEEELDGGRTQKRVARQPSDTKSLVEERAEEVNRQASEHLAQMEWKEKVERAIQSHQLLVGMTENEVLRSLGRPDNISTSTTARGTTTNWRYEAKGVTVFLSFDENAVLYRVGTY